MIRVFVACPAELAEERTRLAEVIEEMNLTWGDTMGTRLELVKWETHAYPGFGPDPQAVIDEQIGNNYDIFVGILWTKFGTPTKTAGSGTEQEFRAAYSRYIENPEELRIMFYFKDGSISPGQIDASQLLKVQQFRQELGELGSLYWTYKTLDEFANFMRIHLAKQVQTWRRVWGRTKYGTPKTDSDTARSATSSDSASTELGFLDLMEIVEDAFAELTDAAARIGGAVEILGQKMAQRTTELGQGQAIDQSSRIRYFKRVANALAADMQDFCARMEIEVPIFANRYRRGTDAMARAAVMMMEFGGDQRANIQGARVSIHNLRGRLQESRALVVAFRDAVRGSPGATASSITARNHTVAVLDSLSGEFEDALLHTASLEKILEELSRDPEQ